jgi:hypothetical protein
MSAKQCVYEFTNMAYSNSCLCSVLTDLRLCCLCLWLRLHNLQLADLVLWKPVLFGAKPEIVIKGGIIAYAQMGDPNASIPTPEVFTVYIYTHP